jgi:bifunctional non-homologous end joining protein LigD
VTFRPADLIPVREAFDDSRFVYELKHDGFRALAYIRSGHCQLVSRRGNVYKSFGSLSAALGKLDHEAVLDGEIVVLDSAGRSMFYELLRRRGEPVFYAFDCLSLEGRDLRPLPLIHRKKKLERLVNGHARILYARHVESDGAAFFRLVCEQDLEGIVAKLKHGTYGEGWFKIRNPGYFAVRRATRVVREACRSWPGMNAYDFGDDWQHGVVLEKIIRWPIS